MAKKPVKKRQKPGPRPLDPDQKRSQVLQVIVNEAEKIEIEARAKESGQSVSVYLRRLGLGQG